MDMVADSSALDVNKGEAKRGQWQRTGFGFFNWNNERLRSRGSKPFSRRSALPSWGVPGVPGVPGEPGVDKAGESNCDLVLHIGDAKYEASGARGESAMFETMKLGCLEGQAGEQRRERDGEKEVR